MKLLDNPIHKEADVSNKEAIVTMLTGAGIGAGVGTLGEYMLTGKLGWKGGALGALLGTGTAAFLNPEARQKLISNVQKREEGGTTLGSVPEEQYGEGVTLGGDDASKAKEPSPDQLYGLYNKALSSGQEFSEEDTAAMKQFIGNYDQYQVDLAKDKEDVALAVKLQSDPEYAKSLELSRSGTDLEKLRGGGVDVSIPVYRYAGEYKRKMGQNPTPEHLLRFTRHTRDGLSPDGWDDYMTDQHALSGEDEYPLSLAALQVGGGYTASKAMKPLIKKLMTTPQGRKTLQSMLGKSGQKIGVKGAAKLGARAIPGLNIAMDVPEFFLDPVTGEYTTNVGKNISEQDRLMELRERKGTMFTGDKRNMQYNMSAGALRGWFNPLTSTAIAGKRLKDTAGAGITNIKNRGVLQGAASNVKAGAATVAQVGSELWNPIQDIFSKKKVQQKQYNWGTNVPAATQSELKAKRDEMANRLGYYEVDGKRVPIKEYHKKEGQDHMDKIELVRRVIRKQAALQKEAINPNAIKRASTELIPYSKNNARWQTLKRKVGFDPTAKTNVKGLVTGGALAGGGGLAASWMLSGGDDIEKQTALESPITDSEVQDARDKRDKDLRGGKPQVQGAEVPTELLAGAAGAAAGGAAGYALAPKLGIGRAAGALGGATLTALASALLANKLKQQPKPATA